MTKNRMDVSFQFDHWKMTVGFLWYKTKLLLQAIARNMCQRIQGERNQ